MYVLIIFIHKLNVENHNEATHRSGGNNDNTIQFLIK